MKLGILTGDDGWGRGFAEHNERVTSCERPEGAITGFFYALGSFLYRDNTPQEEQTQTRPPLL